jgi:hypothetical protein
MRFSVMAAGKALPSLRTDNCFAFYLLHQKCSQEGYLAPQAQFNRLNEQLATLGCLTRHKIARS